MDCTLGSIWRKTFELEEDRVTSYSQETVSSLYRPRLLDGWYKKLWKKQFDAEKQLSIHTARKQGLVPEERIYCRTSVYSLVGSPALARVSAERLLPLRGTLFRGEHLSVCSAACTLSHFLMSWCLMVWVWPDQDIFMKTYVKTLKVGVLLKAQFNKLNVISPLFCSGSASWAPNGLLPYQHLAQVFSGCHCVSGLL